METTDEESSSTGHTETTVDSRKMSPSGASHAPDLQSRSASPLALLTLDSGKITIAL